MMEQKSRVKKNTKITIVIFCAIAVCIVAFILHETNKEEKISFDAAAKIAINDAGFGFYEPPDYQDSGETTNLYGSDAEYKGRAAYKVTFEDKEGNKYMYLIDSLNGEILQSEKTDSSN